MDLLYVYEDKVALDTEGNYYIGTAFSQEVFDRYLRHFDKITMLMRKSDIAPNDSEALSRMNKISTERIQIVFLPNPNASLKNFLSPKLAREYRRLVIGQITDDRAVIVRAPSVSGKIAVEHCHKIGKPVLVEAVGCPWDSAWNHSLKGKILAPKYWVDFRKTMRLATHAIYVTSEFLQNRYPTPGKSVAISDVELQPMNEEVLHRRLEKIRNHSGTIKIATAGAVNAAYKGQQFVIEALSILKKQGKTDFEYHLAGGGDNAALQALSKQLGVENQVVFEGGLPHDAMFAWLDDMDLYIQPSLQEGLPRAVVEAMSRGLPALGARTGGIPELLDEECIFARKDVGDIAEKLTNLGTEQMLVMAKTNFDRAKEFQRERLELRRFAFYSAFAAEVKGRQQ